MFVGFIVFFVLVSGDFASSFYLKTKFGEITPITVLGYGLIVYIAGLFGCLNAGIIIVALCIVGIYFSVFLSILFDRKRISRLSCFFSLPFFCFFLLFLLLMICDYQQLVTGTDDPAHWLDCVKVMTYSGEYYANPAYHSSFPTYPPMMALVQLIIQKQYLFLAGGAFCEWLMFLTYHMVLMSLFCPFLVILNSSQEIGKKLQERIKEAGFLFLVITIIGLIVCVFFRNSFSRLQIDPFLACEAATIILIIIFYNEIRYSYLLICVLLPAIVLTKDLGMLFSVFALILFVQECYQQKRIKRIILPLFLLLISKKSWQWVIKKNGAIDPKPNQVNWKKYFEALVGLHHYKEPYKNDTISHFRKALFEKSISLGNNAIQIKYIYVIIIMALLSLIVVFLFSNKKIQRGIVISYICFFVYYIGLGGVYVDKFVPTEAVQLASFERYTNTFFCMIIMEIFIIIIASDRNNRHFYLLFSFLIVLGVVSPISNIGKYVTRQYPQEEHSIRSKADIFAEELCMKCEPNSTVYFVCQADYGTQYTFVKFMIRPYLFLQSTEGDDYNWCFVERADPNNIYYKQMSNAQWEEIIFEPDTYDYFAIMNCDDYFKKEFGSLFKDLDTLTSNCVYRVNHEDRCLEYIGD